MGGVEGSIGLLVFELLDETNTQLTQYTQLTLYAHSLLDPVAQSVTRK